MDNYEFVTISSEGWKLLNQDSINQKSLYQKSKLSTEGLDLKNLFYKAIENYFVKAIFDRYKICIKIKPATFYKSTTGPYISFKCSCVICFALNQKKTGIY